MTPPAPSKSNSPTPIYREFGEGRTWRIFRVMAELVEGYTFLASIARAVTVFGSARTLPTSWYYQEAQKLGRLLAKGKFSTVTGGGPGIMEAANKGAYEGGGESIGINIQLPREQRINPYVKKAVGFYYFFTRKVILTAPSQAFVFFPGGFGTLDEFFEVLDLIRSERMMRVPLIMVDRKFWQPLLEFLRHNAYQKIHALREEDLTLFHIVDTAEEVYEIVHRTKERPRCEISPEAFCDGDEVNWRVFRIMAELVEGYQFLQNVKNPVTVIGTAHIKLQSRFYSDAYRICKELGRRGKTIITGGGPGIMEAANKGATHAGAESLGLDISVDHKERINPFVRRSISFHYTFVRKYMLSSPSLGFILFPGGYGTLTECFEVLTLMQTKKMERIPVLLYGREFWQPLFDFIQKNVFEREAAVAPEDMSLFKIIDTPEAAVKEMLAAKRRSYF
ncbi:MAG: hypothetical protein HW383_377 [Candidatus Magasanikbacteria bacterium]|nr:hypothetical protein [Candidatus Magasanikbacteria bacterium]